MLNEDNKILKYNYGENSLKAAFIIYADLECLLEIMHSCQNNFEKSYTEKKISIHLLLCSIYKLFVWPRKNKLDCCKGDDCMESFCKDLREHAMKIMNYGKKITGTPNRWRKRALLNQKLCYICQKNV